MRRLLQFAGLLMKHQKPSFNDLMKAATSSEVIQMLRDHNSSIKVMKWDEVDPHSINNLLYFSVLALLWRPLARLG